MSWIASVVFQRILVSNEQSSFSISIRQLNYEWSKLGSFNSDELPIGVTITLESSTDSQVFIDILIDIEAGSYAGRVILERKEKLTRGMTTLFANSPIPQVLLVGLAVRLSDRGVRETTSTESQTVNTEMANAGVQINLKPSVSDKCVNTDARIIIEEELWGSLREALERQLEAIPMPLEAHNDAANPESVHVAKEPEVPCDPQPTFSILPRLHRLRQLDRAIVNKNKELELRTKNDILEKARIIKEARSTEQASQCDDIVLPPVQSASPTSSTSDGEESSSDDRSTTTSESTEMSSSDENTNSTTSEDVMATEDPKLRILRTEIFSLTAAFPQPSTAFKIVKEYEDNFDCDIPFKQFGYPNMESFLNDHPMMDAVFFEGKRCYKAKVSEKSADLQAMVGKQKKKKKKGKGNFQRSNFQSRTFSSRDGPRGGGERSSQRGRGRSSFTNAQQFNKPVFSTTYSKYTGPIVPPTTASPCGPVVGVNRILRALDKCSGKATLMKLNFAYNSLYKTSFNSDELKRHFGKSNMRSIHQEYFSDKIEMTVVPGGQWMFVSKDLLEKQKEWEKQNANIEVIARTVNWDKPSIAKLFDNVVKMLENMYPSDLPLDGMSEVYTRAHAVHVNPMELYAKTWEDLVTTIFKGKLKLTPNGRVCLSDNYLRIKGLGAFKEPAAHIQHMERVTAEDLGLEYFDDDSSSEDDASQCSEAVDDSFVSLPASGRSTPQMFARLNSERASVRLKGISELPSLFPLSFPASVRPISATSVPAPTRPQVTTTEKRVTSPALNPNRIHFPLAADLKPPRMDMSSQASVVESKISPPFKGSVFSRQSYSQARPENVVVSRPENVVVPSIPPAKGSVFSRLSYRGAPLLDADSAQRAAMKATELVLSPEKPLTKDEEKPFVELMQQLNSLSISAHQNKKPENTSSIKDLGTNVAVKKKGFGFKKIVNAITSRLGSSASSAQEQTINSSIDDILVDVSTNPLMTEMPRRNNVPIMNSADISTDSIVLSPLDLSLNDASELDSAPLSVDSEDEKKISPLSLHVKFNGSSRFIRDRVLASVPRGHVDESL